jgi:type VI secretion system protein ImpF
MPRLDGDSKSVRSILDRLIDERPDVSSEPAGGRLQNVEQLRGAVARDLQALLNTRREGIDDGTGEDGELARSVINYGLPDFTSLSVNGMTDRRFIVQSLEEAIARFEPRLEQVAVKLENPRAHDHRFRFRIDALLRVEPALEPVVFDAVLELNTHQYRVRAKD